MGLLDKFKEIITENDDDFDDYYDDDNRDYGLAAPERAERQERSRHERAPAGAPGTPAQQRTGR